ncbi:DUF1588 domain-containing protein [Rhodopirellula sp.]|nr:DUF1588 domain-containing protein [Rhodopirellula sp.]
MNYCMSPDVVCRFIEYRRTTVVVLGFIAGCCTAVLGNAVVGSAVEPDTLFRVPADVQAVFRDNCIDCHNEDVAEGNVDLSRISELGSSERFELLNKAQEQLHFGIMPPEESVQLSSVDQGKVLKWVGAELREHGASRLEDKLRKPGYGNYLDHDELFSGRHTHLQPFTYDRRWLISEFIFEARFNEILSHRPFKTIDGKRQYVIGDNNRRVNLTNPFLLPTNTGVRYYANATLNRGHLLTMLTNAKEAANHMLYLAGRDRRYVPAIYEIMDMEWTHARTLADREKFLKQFIGTILGEMYGEQHVALLPDFKPVVIKSSDSTGIKKSPFHAAQPGAQELVVLFHSMEKNRKDGDSDAEWIDKCQRDWFNQGDSERLITTRLTFLAGYLEEFREQVVRHRYAKKHKLPVYRPRADEEQTEIEDAVRENRKSGDRYVEIINKCLDQWRVQFQNERQSVGVPAQETIGALVLQLYQLLYHRPPTEDELVKYGELTHKYLGQLGNLAGIKKLIQTLILKTDFVYRSEFGSGDPDEHGRRMMSARDGSYAIAYAITDSSPDSELEKAVAEGRLNSRADYRREVKRMLAGREQYYVIDEAVQRLQLTASITNTPIRKLRFFREFFGYPQLLSIFKDNKRFGGNYDNAKGRLVGEADRLVDHILNADKDVFHELLTTEKFYVYHSGDNAAMSASSQRIRDIYDHFKGVDWKNYTSDDLEVHAPFIKEVKMRGMGRNPKDDLRTFKTVMTSFTTRFDKGQSAAAPFDSFPAHGKSNADTRTGLQLRSPEVAKFFNIELDDWNYPVVQPAYVQQRKGMLTHPAWLIAHAQNTETDPVRRGRWVQEKLLAGTVPDLPITVDAVIPEDHHRTLRQRLDAKTEEAYCWKCHQKMNPLGLPFEIYDDFGRYRQNESLEHPDNLLKKGPDKAAPHVDLRDTYKTLPVQATGTLVGSGSDLLDGDVTDALDLIDKLDRSERVRQSLIRYAFRFFMGRNEMLSDSRTLIDADQAYVKSGGSFDAVIVSLLTSDSFLFRKENQH